MPQEPIYNSCLAYENLYSPMNIWENGTERTIEGKQGYLTVSGNGNRLVVVSSDLTLTINGNSNRV